jgi:hypothetical protein
MTSVAHKAYYGSFDYSCLPCGGKQYNSHFIGSTLGETCRYQCDLGYEVRDGINGECRNLMTDKAANILSKGGIIYNHRYSSSSQTHDYGW